MACVKKAVKFGLGQWAWSRVKGRTHDRIRTKATISQNLLEPYGPSTHGITTFQILRCKAAPGLLVLQFIEDILAIGSVAIQLTQRQDFAIQRRDQSGVFPQLLVGFDLAEAQQCLPRLGAVVDGDAVRQFAAQQDDTAVPAPAM